MQAQRETTSSDTRSRRGSPYRAPKVIGFANLSSLIEDIGRPPLSAQQYNFLTGGISGKAVGLWYAGDLTLLSRPAVSIVGTRDVSSEGRRRAEKLAAILASAGVTVVSGLARGVDTAAHLGALGVGGATAAVIGTPLQKAYPVENAALQEQLYKTQLLVSPFASGETVYKGNFPKRNRVMAALTDATVIVEASDTSGTLHQAAECVALGRWLFIMKSVLQTPDVSWPQRFINNPRTVVLETAEDVLKRIAP